MATYVKKSGGGAVFLYLILFMSLIALCVVAYYGYQKWTHLPDQPLTQGDISALDARVDALDARLTAQEHANDKKLAWTVAKWVLIIAAVTFLVWFWIKKHFENAIDRLTIDKGLELGVKELQEKFSFTTLWKYGSSMQRREGSEERVLLLTFSRFPLVPGTHGLHSATMYIAVLNSSWEHRFLSRPGMTFDQFMDHLHQLEMVGFSVQKEEEMAGLLKLQERAQAIGSIGKIGEDLGFTSAE